MTSHKQRIKNYSKKEQHVKYKQKWKMVIQQECNEENRSTV